MPRGRSTRYPANWPVEGLVVGGYPGGGDARGTPGASAGVPSARGRPRRLPGPDDRRCTGSVPDAGALSGAARQASHVPSGGDAVVPGRVVRGEPPALRRRYRVSGARTGPVAGPFVFTAALERAGQDGQPGWFAVPWRPVGRPCRRDAAE